MNDIQGNNEQLLQKLNEMKLENDLLRNQAARLKDLESEIIDLRQREEELKKSEEQFRLMNLHAKIGIACYTPEGIIISYNSLAAKYMNGNPGDFKGKSIFDVFPGKEAEIYLNRIKRSAASDEPVNYEDMIDLPSGRKYFLSIFSRIFDSGNNLLGIQIISQDITYRKEVEDKLKDSEEKFKLMFEYAPDAYFLSDMKGVFIDGNLAAEKLLGQDKRELIGRNYLKLNLLSANQIQKAAKLLIKNALGQATGPDIFTLNRKDESEVTAEILTYPVKIKNQKMVLGIARDITERKKIERELSESHKENIETATLLNAVLDAIPDMIGIQNLEHEIIRYNKAGYTFLGKTQEEVCGKKCYTLIGRTKECDICSTTECLKTKKPAQHQQFFPEYNIWFDMRSYPILDEKGNITLIIEHIRDISDNKSFEKRLIESKEKAEESDRLKSAFLANMSHEIRTPMNGIMGFAELLRNPMLSGEEIQDYIDIIRTSGKRMLNIINDLIDVSVIEAGQMNVCFSDCNVNDIIQYSYDFFKPGAVKKHLDISFKKLLPDNKVITKTDKDKVTAILGNLISNAIKFTDTGSVEFGYRVTDNDYLEFYVKDTGIGITPDQREIIFERFRQGSENLNRNYEGAGLGLYICRKYAEMLGGKIWVENNPDNSGTVPGSLFKFIIPFNMTNESADQSESKGSGESPTVHHKTLKILIVEDDEPSLILLTKLVKSVSREILIARTGTEAVENCRNNPDLDLILMDIKMPEMDGYAATKLIREFNTEVVIIAQTAYGQIGENENAVEAGCNDYISKPIIINELLTMINKYL